MKERSIGIVGGVGPYAGIALQTAIVRNTRARSDQEYLPMITVSAPHEIADRTDFLLGKVSVNPAFAIIDQIKTLYSGGARFIGIPCNTAHADEIFLPIKKGIEELNGAILVNMIDETFIEIKEHVESQTVGVLATKGSYKSNLFPKYGDRYGCSVAIPDNDSVLDDIHTSIYNKESGIKATGTLSKRSKEKLDRALDDFDSMNIHSIILGCTELSVVFKERKYKTFTFIDPIEILARKLIALYGKD